MTTHFLKPAKLVATQGCNRRLIWWMILLILTRLWLVEAQDVLATYTPADDYLFVKVAVL